ncbi:MAG: UvrD-helicase domain-containing protein, partial [Firmicutes bacterium]|nr:UvrD-helicase domain-containing protein [Bacillota bacterium]
MDEKTLAQINALNRLLADVYPFDTQIKVSSILQANGFSVDDLKQLKNRIDSFLNSVINSLNFALTDRKSNIIVLRYGLLTGRELTLDEIGKQLGVTRERIRQLQERILKRLNKSLKEIVLHAASIIIGNPIEIIYTQNETLEQRNIKKNLPERAGAKWTEQEDNELVALYEGGKSIFEIKELFNRGRGGIAARLKIHGYVDSYGNVPTHYTGQRKEVAKIKYSTPKERKPKTNNCNDYIKLFTIAETMNFKRTIKEFFQTDIIVALRNDGYIKGESVDGIYKNHSTTPKGNEHGFIGEPMKNRETIYLDARGQEFIEKYVHNFYNISKEIIKPVEIATERIEKPNLSNTLILFAKNKSEFFALNNYISQSMIDKFKQDYLDEYNQIKLLLAENEIASVDIRQAQELVSVYENIINLSEAHNERFIEHNLIANKKYFDNILKTVDANVMLDSEQRRAIVADEDYCLLIAGAGAGKTTTMAAKVKYLTEMKGVKPQDIVVISYTNKAIDELKERIQDKLGIPANVVTFHKFGYDILKSSSNETPTIEYSAANYVFECLEKQVFNDKVLLNKIMLFLGYYLNIPEEALNFENLNAYYRYKANSDFQTMKSNAGEYIRVVQDKRRTEQKRTITGEYVRSDQEVQIANFLYLNNVAYEYEKHYPNFKNSKGKPYQPDFTITQDNKTFYIEHFGISENFLNNRFNGSDLNKYKNSILFKRKLHKDNNTTLIETFSSYNDKRNLIEHLKEQLERFGVEIKPRSDEEVYKKLVETSKDKYVYRFGYLILDFIGRFKEMGLTKTGFEDLRKKQDNVRTNLFLEIAEAVYNYYQEQLVSKNSIDFADMINNAELMLRDAEQRKIYLPYRYIIIDEFQDIARQRFNLTKTLSNITGAKIIAVGDDWQSIFAFAGSDITLFQRFLYLMGHGIEMQINHTYRNAQELIDIAGGFIQKNPTQIRKRLISPKSIKDPIEVIEYDGTQSSMQNWANIIHETIDRIVSQYGEKSSILLITRFNFEKDKLCNKSGRYKNMTLYFTEGKGDRLIWSKNKNVRIDCLTAHSSKGLGYDNVVVLNMREAVFGFPSQLDD